VASLLGKSGGSVGGVEVRSIQNVPRPVLIGRESETSQLSNALEHALIGNGRAIALVGEVGIGKTQLLSYVKSEAVSRNATVISATCSSLPGSPPLWPWREVFSNLNSEHDLESTDTPLDISSIQSSAADAEQNLELFANIVSSLREASSTNPLLICLDDLHWADSSSLDLISFAVSQLSSAAVSIVISLRAAETDSAFERAMEMAEKHNVVPLQLRILRIRTQFSQHNKQYDKILLMRDQALKLNRTTASDMDLSLLHVHAAIAEASIGETKKSTISLDTAKLIANELGIESNLYHLTCANLAIAQAKFDDAIEHASELERIENGPVEAMFDLLKRA